MVLFPYRKIFVWTVQEVYDPTCRDRSLVTAAGRQKQQYKGPSGRMVLF
ncbi:uncharacterized protein METZ01_LOCUS92959 [marine metagenome]|uniref:Uncharacterized protein n=1 Tax=marine metagenome TaxID=408172 RepID=A0A381VIC9_9ZZZZ